MTGRLTRRTQSRAGCELDEIAAVVIAAIFLPREENRQNRSAL
jgi:hypothetical protein